MRVQHNITAMGVSRQMNISQSAKQKSMERLSSGYRINRAADDAAGLAISEKMRVQIRGLHQASSNLSNGINLVQAADGAMNEVSSILQRIRELSVQSANETNTMEDRDNLQDEVEQLLEEVDRIGIDTEFNTIPILQGDKITVKLDGADAQPAYRLVDVSDVDGFDDVPKFNPSALIQAQDSAITTPALPGSLTCSKTLDFSNLNNSNKDALLNAGFIFGCSQNCNQTFSFKFVSSVSIPENNITQDKPNGTYPYEDAGKQYGILDKTPQNQVSKGSSKEFEIALDSFSNGAELVSNLYNYILEMNHTDGIHNRDINQNLNDPDANGNTHDNYTIYNVGHANYLFGTGSKLIVAGNGDNAQINSNIRNYPLFDASQISDIIIESEEAPSGLLIQAGANEGQIIMIQLPQVDTDTIGLNSLDITTHQNAAKTITVVDEAIQYMNNERSRMGAYQNRMAHSYANVTNTAENLAAAESRIRDTDMAKEMTTNAKYDVLQQTSSFLLTQANKMTDSILQLLNK